MPHRKLRSLFAFGGRLFSTQAAVKERAKEILNRVPLGEALSGEDDYFIRDLFSLHEESNEKLAGHEPRYFFVRNHPEWGNRNFMVMRSDGQPVHFSYLYALKPTPRHQWFGIAARSIVEPQTRAYRDEYFARHGGPDGQAPCELTGKPMTKEESDVHHAGTMQFRHIVSAFLAERRLDPEQIEYVGTTQGAPVLRLVDEELEEVFARYHEEKAVLQVVSKDAHRRLDKS